MSDGYVMLTKREYDALRARAIIAEATVDELENHHAAAKMRLTEVEATLTGTQVALDWRIKERDALAAELAQWRGNYQTLLDDSVTIRARLATLEAALRDLLDDLSEDTRQRHHRDKYRVYQVGPQTIAAAEIALGATTPPHLRGPVIQAYADTNGLPSTAGEPLPKLECGMGCGRTFCSPEGRDHHEELCHGTAGEASQSDTTDGGEAQS